MGSNNDQSDAQQAQAKKASCAKTRKSKASGCVGEPAACQRSSHVHAGWQSRASSSIAKVEAAQPTTTGRALVFDTFELVGRDEQVIAWWEILHQQMVSACVCIVLHARVYMVFVRLCEMCAAKCCEMINFAQGFICAALFWAFAWCAYPIKVCWCYPSQRNASGVEHSPICMHAHAHT